MPVHHRFCLSSTSRLCPSAWFKIQVDNVRTAGAESTGNVFDEVRLQRSNEYFPDIMTRKRNGKLHHDTYPAWVDSDGTQQWFRNNKLHRDPVDGVEYPAFITRVSPELETWLVYEWYCRGELHRDSGPAWVIMEDGEPTNQEWVRHGKRHRDNNEPAVVWSNGRREWWVNGERVPPWNLRSSSKKIRRVTSYA